MLGYHFQESKFELISVVIQNFKKQEEQGDEGKAVAKIRDGQQQSVAKLGSECWGIPCLFNCCLLNIYDMGHKKETVPCLSGARYTKKQKSKDRHGIEFKKIATNEATWDLFPLATCHVVCG